MSFHNYTSLNHPIAQIAAAEDFCDNISEFVDDCWEDIENRPAPNVDEVHVHNVLDVLASIGLRFETAGSEDFTGPDACDHDHYFKIRYQGQRLDAVLHSLAGQVAEGLQEYFTQEGSDEPAPMHDVWRLVSLNGCSSDLIFVPDTDAVATAAYHLILKTKSLPNYMESDDE